MWSWCPESKFSCDTTHDTAYINVCGQWSELHHSTQTSSPPDMSLPSLLVRRLPYLSAIRFPVWSWSLQICLVNTKVSSISAETYIWHIIQKPLYTSIVTDMTSWKTRNGCILTKWKCLSSSQDGFLRVAVNESFVYAVSCEYYWMFVWLVSTVILLWRHHFYLASVSLGW